MKFFLFALILLSLSISSFAARIPLAVYGVVPQGVSQTTADIVTDMVRMKLRACGRFDLIEKAKMEEILKEQGFQQTGCTETECAVKMGKVLNVKKMVVGGLGKIGTAYRLSLRVVDVETAVIEAEDAESQTVKEEEMETKLVPPLVARLCPKIKSGGEVPTPVPGVPEVSTGSLTVNSTPSGATVFLDGEGKGDTPVGLSAVPVGEHQLVITKEGYADYSETVTVSKGTKKLVSANLKMQIGSLRISTTPSGASVSVDGIARGVTTEAGLLVSGLRVGEHQVRAAKAKYEAYESSAFVEPDVTKEVKIDLSAKPGSVVITSTPSGAEVFIDGVSKGVTSCSVSGLMAGMYSVKLKKEGYEEHSGNVVIQAGRASSYFATLNKITLETTSIPVNLPRSKFPLVLIETNMGTITIELYPQIAPKSVANFIKLTQDGFYNGTLFHRVVPNFVIQGGDPLTKDPTKKDVWGTGGPSYKFADEPVYGDYVAGAVAMANSGPNTNGSQFFICLKDLTGRLGKNYNLFGQVIQGMDVVYTIAAVARDERDCPKSNITMNKVVIIEPVKTNKR
jgi:peptidyl-prolyl cis-trans isomerase B (cyclophilin B)